MHSLLGGQSPSVLRKFGNEWGFNTLSDDLTITSHFKGSINWAQQGDNFQSGIPVWGSSKGFVNSFDRGDYIRAQLLQKHIPLATVLYGEELLHYL